MSNTAKVLATIDYPERIHIFNEGIDLSPKMKKLKKRLKKMNRWKFIGLYRHNIKAIVDYHKKDFYDEILFDEDSDEVKIVREKLKSHDGDCVCGTHIDNLLIIQKIKKPKKIEIIGSSCCKIFFGREILHKPKCPKCDKVKLVKGKSICAQCKKKETYWRNMSRYVSVKFGKYKGCTIPEIYKKDKKYINWLVSQQWVFDNVRNACISCIFVDTGKLLA